MAKENYKELIIKKLIQEKVKNTDDFFNVLRKLSKKSQEIFPTKIELLKAYRNLVKAGKIKPAPGLENLLKIREVRTLSGIASITVITKPYPCPGKCIYCPNEIDMPKSYLANEPACMRAKLTKFDPYKQVKTRLKALEMTGHPTDKIELIILGGSWSAYPKKYQTWFIKKCFDACNEKDSKSLKEAQKLNEKAKHRIVGLTLETRPDFITPEEIKRMRKLGCTRVELGVQSIYDDILALNKRGHNTKSTIEATRLLKDAGFKITYHIMLNLPGSNPKKDERMFKELFSNPDFQPDQLKIYPCVVLKTSPLYKLYKQGKYKPYSKNQLINLLIKIKEKIPPYVRIIRVIRDIPSQSIIAGNKATNLRQLILEEMNRQNKKCKCIRCREIKDIKVSNKDIKLFRKDYPASEGKEIFLSFEDIKKDKIIAFLRLRITDHWTLSCLKNCAIIREVHTYGPMVSIAKKNKYAQQHKKLGKQLIQKAEKIVKKETPFRKIAVISGIGVREYYRKLGYRLKNEYMIKSLS